MILFKIMSVYVFSFVICKAKTIDRKSCLALLRKLHTSVACLCPLYRVSVSCRGNVPHNQVNCLVMIAIVPRDNG